MDTFALLEVRNLLRRDDYSELQYVPFSAHAQEYSALHLEALLEDEKVLLSSVTCHQPILYSYSLNPEHYALRLSRRQRLLGDLFLHSRFVPRATVLRELPEYFELALRLSSGDSEIRCPFRLVPVFDDLFVADPLDSTDDTSVFLHNDSVQLARHLQQSSFHGQVVADVGTGSGILALTALRRGAERVIATDINPRSLHYAELTFLLNDCSSISLCEGSIEQVIREADVIVTNPPYMHGRTALSLDGGGPIGLDTALRFARVTRNYRRRIVMILELAQLHDDDAFLSELQEGQSAKQVLKRRPGFELAVYDFDWNR